MQLTRFRAISATLILLLIGALAGLLWNNSAPQTRLAPTMPVIQVNMPRPLPAVPQTADDKSIPPDAKPFRFNGQTIYLVLIS